MTADDILQEGDEEFSTQASLPLDVWRRMSAYERKAFKHAMSYIPARWRPIPKHMIGVRIGDTMFSPCAFRRGKKQFDVSASDTR